MPRHPWRGKNQIHILIEFYKFDVFNIATTINQR